jgi:hypothetical protein
MVVLSMSGNLLAFFTGTLGTVPAVHIEDSRMSLGMSLGCNVQQGLHVTPCQLTKAASEAQDPRMEYVLNLKSSTSWSCLGTDVAPACFAGGEVPAPTTQGGQVPAPTTKGPSQTLQG